MNLELNAQYYATEDGYYFTVKSLTPITIFIHYERIERVLTPAEVPNCILAYEKHS